MELLFPFLDEPLMVGLAANVDFSLEHRFKLRVWTDANEIKACALKAAKWAFLTFRNDPLGAKYYANAAYAIVMFGLSAKDDGDSIDGNDELITTFSTKDANEMLFDYVLIKKVLTTIISTKINWWLTSHHTGQGMTIQGYAKKVAMATYGFNEGTPELKNYTKFANTVGHWCSTRLVLSKLGIKKIIGVKENKGIAEISISDEEKQLINSPPAGTSRHSIAVKIIKRLVTHWAAKYSTVLLECPSVISTFIKIMEEPARYHMNAIYLTGDRDENFNDYDAARVLGRLVTFVKFIMKKSDIAKSRHVWDGKNFKAEEYDDFSADYHDFLFRFVAGKLNADRFVEIMEKQGTRIERIPEEKFAELMKDMGFRYTANKRSVEEIELESKRPRRASETSSSING